MDVEGQDFEVLMGFIGGDDDAMPKDGAAALTISRPILPAPLLPLIIMVETKSISPENREVLTRVFESRGYKVTDFKNDAFAMLTPEAILHPQKHVKPSD